MVFRFVFFCIRWFFDVFCFFFFNYLFSFFGGFCLFVFEVFLKCFMYALSWRCAYQFVPIYHEYSAALEKESRQNRHFGILNIHESGVIPTPGNQTFFSR